MLSEVVTAQKYLRAKFGEYVPTGTYAVPYQTSKGRGYMKVDVSIHQFLSGFHLYWDEALTISWYTHKNPNLFRRLLKI